MWFKYGLKAQKLLAQGIALGIMAISKAPCKGKSFGYCPYFKACALTGRQGCVRNYPGRCPGLGASALSGRVGLTCESSEQDRKSESQIPEYGFGFRFLLFKNLQILCYYSPRN